MEYLLARNADGSMQPIDPSSGVPIPGMKAIPASAYSGTRAAAQQRAHSNDHAVMVLPTPPKYLGNLTEEQVEVLCDAFDKFDSRTLPDGTLQAVQIQP